MPAFIIDLELTSIHLNFNLRWILFFTAINESIEKKPAPVNISEINPAMYKRSHIPVARTGGLRC